jgi:cytochrome oxidase Cu insertion factor (SCO1/SenC/PrrC family)
LASAETRPNRRAALLLAPAVLAGLAVLAGAFALTAGRGDTRSPSQGAYRGSEPPGGILLPHFDLPSYRGDRVTTRELRGHAVLLTLLDSQCTDACPVIASVVARTIDRLAPGERAEVRALAVTVDPAEDTRTSVRRFLRARRADGRLDYLIGDERKLRPLWEALQILPSLDSGRDTLHSAPVRIYDRAGVWVATLHAGADLSEENLLHDLRRVLRVRGDETR